MTILSTRAMIRWTGMTKKKGMKERIKIKMRMRMLLLMTRMLKRKRKWEMKRMVEKESRTSQVNNMFTLYPFVPIIYQEQLGFLND